MLEKQQSLPRSPMCQPVATPAIPQLRFISTFLEPTLLACEPLAPLFVAMALEGLRESQTAWESVLAEQQDRDGQDRVGAAALGDGGAAAGAQAQRTSLSLRNSEDLHSVLSMGEWHTHHAHGQHSDAASTLAGSAWSRSQSGHGLPGADGKGTGDGRAHTSSCSLEILEHAPSGADSSVRSMQRKSGAEMHGTGAQQCANNAV